jgi:hypothetical protein
MQRGTGTELNPELNPRASLGIQAQREVHSEPILHMELQEEVSFQLSWTVIETHLGSVPVVFYDRPY